jgi:lysophospholipase L1-like esterase
MNVLEFMSVGAEERPLDRMVTDGGFCSIFRTIACIGDSLSSGELESTKEDGTHRYHDFFEYSWGQFIGRSCGSRVYNFSRGGMTAKEYVESFADQHGYWGRDKLAQAYVIALGVNDIYRGYDFGTAEDADLNNPDRNATTFAGYMGTIIGRIKELQPRARIFLVTIPQGNDERDEKRRYHRDLLVKMAEMFDFTYVIDLHTYAPVNDEAFRAVFRRGHLTPAGYVLYARMIESYIDYIIRANHADFAQVGFIGTDLYYNPEDR